MYNEQVCQVTTLLTLLSGLLKPLAGSTAALPADQYERLFIYCTTWSLGGLLDAKDRVRFDTYLRGLTDQAPHKVHSMELQLLLEMCIVFRGDMAYCCPPLFPLWSAPCRSLSQTPSTSSW